MVATVLASSARHIGNSTPRINNKRKSLRWRPDPEPRRVIPVEEEIVIEAHASVRVGIRVGSLEVPTRNGDASGDIWLRKVEREHHGGTGPTVEDSGSGGGGI